MDLKICIFLLSFNSVKCIDWEKLQDFPSPQKHFDINKYVGNWYYTASLYPCSFEGASKFTNSVGQFYVQSDGVLILKYTYRSISCTTLELTKKMNGSPGVFKSKDYIGNPTSGPNVVLATDYKRFAITWSCTKIIGDRCQDVGLYVKTRERIPKASTLKIIESILRYLYDISIADMKKEIHDGKACLTFDKKPRHARREKETSLQKLQNMYRK